MGSLLFLTLGVLAPLETTLRARVLPDAFLPGILGTGLQTLAYQGIFLVLGTAMLTASLFPSRWRGANRPQQSQPFPPYQGQPYPNQAPPYQHQPEPYHIHNQGHSQGQSPGHQERGPEDVTKPMHRE